jgi:hypothetical protein
MRQGKTSVRISTTLSILGEKVVVITSNATSTSLRTGWVMSSRSREMHPYDENDNYEDAREAHDELVNKIEFFSAIPPERLETILGEYITGG